MMTLWFNNGQALVGWKMTSLLTLYVCTLSQCDDHNPSNDERQYYGDIRVQQRTCTSLRWWVGSATSTGCQGCLGPLTDEVSVAWHSYLDSYKSVFAAFFVCVFMGLK